MSHKPPTALQIKTVYLPLSETFVYRHLERLRRWRPHVLAELFEHLERFPLPDVTLLPRPALARRAWFALLRALLRDGTLRAAFRPPPPEALRGARLLHAHFGESGLAALPLARRAGLPLITSFHGRDIATALARPYGRLRYRPLLRAGAAFTAVYEGMRQELLALGAPPERVRVVRTGVDLGAIAFAPRRPPDSGPVRLLTVGRLVEKKGTRYAIEALAHLAPRRTDLELVVLGDGPLRPALERRARDLAPGQVRFLGAQPQERVLAELAAAHLFVLPCVTAADGDRESTPVVLQEAQAAGLPVVSTRHAGVPEVVADGVGGLLAAERDAAGLAALIGRLLDAPERWPAMGEAGRRHIAAHFDVDRSAAALEALYDEVAG